MAGGIMVALLASACSSNAGGTTDASANSAAGGQSTAAVSPSAPTATNAQLAQVAKRVLNPGVNVSALPPEIKTVFADAVHPLTSAQESTWLHCISATSCTLPGSGTKNVAYVIDVDIPVEHIAAGDFLAEAIVSGQVHKVSILDDGGSLSQFLSDFRQLIAEKVNVIASDFGTNGAESAPVLAQAKAAGIAVVNGPTALPAAAAQDLAADISFSNCTFWAAAASTFTAHLKQKGITHPTYATFTGPAGNEYASTWQSCAASDLAKDGWQKVYSGYNVWTPSGETQAASALLASGKHPDAILTDISATQFAQAYASAHQQLPFIVVNGSVDVDAIKAGQSSDMWTSSPNVWSSRISLVAGLAVADGQKPSANPIAYPMNPIQFSQIAKIIDLNVNGSVTAGTLLSPADQNAALKF